MTATMTIELPETALSPGTKETLSLRGATGLPAGNWPKAHPRGPLIRLPMAGDSGGPNTPMIHELPFFVANREQYTLKYDVYNLNRGLVKLRGCHAEIEEILALPN